MIKRYPAWGWMKLGSYFTTIIFTGITTVYAPVLFAEIVDIITEATDRQFALEALWPKVTFYFSLIIGVLALKKFVNHLGAYYGPKLAQQARLYNLEMLSKKSAHFYSMNRIGAVLNKVNQLESSTWGLSSFTSRLLDIIVAMVGVLIAIYLLVPALTIWFLLWIVGFTIAMFFYTHWKQQFDARRAETRSAMNGFFADSVGNMMLVKSFAAGQSEYKQYTKISGKYRDAAITAYQLGHAQDSVTALLFRGLHWGVLAWLLFQWGDGLMSVGYVLMITRYFWSLTDRLLSIGTRFNEASEHLSNAMEMLDIFDEPLQLKNPQQPEICRIQQGAISINNTTYKYKDGSAVFQNLNIDIPAGQKVGLVGHSGSGKSTLTKLLLRFMDPQSGAITIDGQNIASITQDDLRRNISYVPQESILFHRTVYENIAYGNPNASKDKVIEAAKQAHAHEFIESLPKGYDTLVGERGVKLSGGERQRVAIARAMLKQAPILILDEATSSLDTISEKYIQESFETLMQGRTTIVIAHRLSTIQKMDRIIVLDKGQIVEEGSHSELLQKDGVYAELCKHQQDGFIVN